MGRKSGSWDPSGFSYHESAKKKIVDKDLNILKKILNPLCKENLKICDVVVKEDIVPALSLSENNRSFQDIIKCIKVIIGKEGLLNKKTPYRSISKHRVFEWRVTNKIRLFSKKHERGKEEIIHIDTEHRHSENKEVNRRANRC